MVPLLTASPQAIDATIPVPNWASLSKSFIVTFATLENLGCFFSSGLTCGLEAVSRVLVFSLRRAATISQKRSETAQNHTIRVDGVQRTQTTHKVLDLGHRELAHAEQAVLRRDFVPKA